MSKQLQLKHKIPDVEIVILDTGKNIHVTVPFGKKYEVNNVTVEPKRENLFLVKGFMKKERYVALFDKLGNPIKMETPKIKKTVEGKQVEVTQVVTAETLQIANNSQSLKSGLSDLFSNPMNTRKIMFLMIIGAVGVVVYMIMSGAVTL